MPSRTSRSGVVGLKILFLKVDMFLSRAHYVRQDKNNSTFARRRSDFLVQKLVKNPIAGNSGDIYLRGLWKCLSGVYREVPIVISKLRSKFWALVGSTRGGTGGSISTACSTPKLFLIFFLTESHLSKCHIGKLHVHPTECIITSIRWRLLWLEPSLFLPAWSMKTEKWIIYYRWPIWL